MSSLLGSLFVATLLLTLGGSSALEAEADSGPHSLPGRKLLQAGPAPAPGPFQFGAVLPNSDPTCDPRWAYETGCYSDYSCARGHICTCKNGDKCADGGYFGIFLCPCDEAPQLPPAPSPPPAPLATSPCVDAVKRTCPSARNTTDAVDKCTAVGGKILLISAGRYSCTCCTGTGLIYAFSPPAIRAPPPPPYKSQSNLGDSVQKKVGIIIGCTWGGIAVIIGTVVTCYCCYCKKRAPGLTARRNYLEQPPLIGRPTKAPETEFGGGSTEAGAKKWFEPGFNGSTFKTTGAGLFFSKSIPKNARFVEIFATVYRQDGNGAGTSSATGSEAHWTKEDESPPGSENRGSTRDESPPAAGGTYSYSSGAADAASERTAKGKEPETPTADAPPASIEGLPEDEICIVCCNAPKECVFVPCGHHATCLACGRLVQQGGQGCPVCRRPIERVLKIYEA